ncbi:MAG TPA: hypothetical protein VGF94_22430 [Kofleriaceae bacterium]|jgi:hypothetical protein
MSRAIWILAGLAACGGGSNATRSDAAPDVATSQCQPIGAIGSFYRRDPNPRLTAGRSFTDDRIEVLVADPDLHWDDGAQLWQLYYHGPRATTYTAPNTQTITHATSPDLATWTVQDAPALAVDPDPTAWDHTNTETPSVVENPDAPAAQRYLMLYSGAAGQLGSTGLTAYAIGAAFSADGVTFTRASDSPVLTGADAYPDDDAALVADPEVAYVAGTYQLWFSSYACTGTPCVARAYGIGHATSTDGLHWSVDAAPIHSLLRAAADLTSGGSQPSVIYDTEHCRWEMWLHSDATGDDTAQPVQFNNMAGVWHATSNDGAVWSIQYSGTRDLEWMQSEASEDLGLLTGADVAAKGNARYLVYVGFTDQNVPGGFVLPTASGTTPGVTALSLATRDAPQ